MDGADLAEQDERGETALHVAALMSSPAAVVLIASNGAPVNAEDSLGRTPLVGACANLCVPVMKALVRAGATYAPRALEAVLRSGRVDTKTAANRATYTEALQMVVKLGRDGNVDIAADHPLHLVRDPEALGILVRGGVGIDGRGTVDVTPLNHYLFCDYDQGLVEEPSCEVVECFLKFGADPNARDGEGYTPLLNYLRDWSIIQPRIVDLLLRADADETLVGAEGCDAAQYVMREGFDAVHRSAVLRLLTNAPADRRWRGRALLPMCIARYSRGFVPVEPVAVSDDDPWTVVAAWLLDMGWGG